VLISALVETVGTSADSSLALIGLFVVLLTTVGLGATLVRTVSGTSLDPEQVVGMSLFLVFLGLPSLGISVFFLNLYSDIRVLQDGIEVQVFLLWWIFVPWENVLDIRPTIQSRILGHRRSQLILVRRLTIFHRYIGWSLGMTLKPAINIKGTQRGYDDAVRLIRERLGKSGDV
jgi:hypothetical protein